MIRDIIYFDAAKAASLLSQVLGGLPQKSTNTIETQAQERNQRTYDLLKVFKGEFGGHESSKVTSALELQLLHHDLLVKIEAVLSEQGLLCDLNATLPPETTDAEAVRDSIKNVEYVAATGWTAFEDYGRLTSISAKFNGLQEFIARCGANETVNALRDERHKLEIESGATDGNRIKKIREKEKEIESLIKKGLEAQKLQPWLIEGLSLWQSTFMSERINLRLFPFEKCPYFELIANLKRDGFVDDDLGHIMYGYGTYPNKQLTVVGLITSAPSRNPPAFDARQQARTTNEDERKADFEAGFRTVFAALDALESFSTFHTYPRIVVHPIAVYRRIATDHAQSQPTSG